MILSQLKKTCCIVLVSCLQDVQQLSATLLIFLSNNLQEQFCVNSISDPLNSFSRNNTCNTVLEIMPVPR